MEAIPWKLQRELGAWLLPCLELIAGYPMARERSSRAKKKQKNADFWYHSHAIVYNIVQMVIKQPTINLLRLQVKNCKPTSLLLLKQKQASSSWLKNQVLKKLKKIQKVGIKSLQHEYIINGQRNNSPTGFQRLPKELTSFTRSNQNHYSFQDFS